MPKLVYDNFDWGSRRQQISRDALDTYKPKFVVDIQWSCLTRAWLPLGCSLLPPAPASSAGVLTLGQYKKEMNFDALGIGSYFV